jgi:hypothetical protein
LGFNVDVKSNVPVIWGGREKKPRGQLKKSVALISMPTLKVNVATSGLLLSRQFRLAVRPQYGSMLSNTVWRNQAKSALG